MPASWPQIFQGWSDWPRSALSRVRWGWVLAAVAGAVLFYMAVVIFPRVFALFWYPGIKRLLYEDLAFSNAWSSVFALIGSFFFAVIWVPLLRWTLRALVWKFNARQFALALTGWIVVYGHVPLLHALLGSEVCVNQRTGEALKWYVVQLGGQIVLFDSPGYDAAGVEKRPATPQICRIVQLQKRGIRPREITNDPRYVKFFDEVTGQPRVWYSKFADGRIDLFDAEGAHPVVGEPLLRMTKEVVQEALGRAEAKEAETKRAVQLKAAQEAERQAKAARVVRLEEARAEAEAKEKARKELVELFGVASYPDGVVIVGATARQKNDISSQAAMQLLNILAHGLRRKGLVVDEFRPQVYAAGHFDALINGHTAVLSQAGLAQKMRAALLTVVEASCQSSSAVAGVTSCTIAVQVRLLTSSGIGSLRQWSQTGAGGNATQAVTRAAELLLERHPDVLDGT